MDMMPSATATPFADDADARLLDDFQRDLPLVPRPFAAIAVRMGLSEAEVIARLAEMRAAGRIARVGATVRPNTAGASTLAALAAPPAELEAIAAMICAEPGVNHAYAREDHWNLWFVATGPDRPAVGTMLDRIAARTGLRVLDLRLVRPFNIDLGFGLRSAARVMRPAAPADASALRPGDRDLLHILSHEGLALLPAPFAALAARLGRSEAEVIGRIAALLAGGILGRLGVIVRHRALGWTENAMVVWDQPPATIAAAGRALAAVPGVTLCYQRRSEPGVWPYALYCMIHGRSRAETLAVLDGARRLPLLAGSDHRVLFSTRCFRQSGAILSEAA